MPNCGFLLDNKKKRWDGYHYDHLTIAILESIWDDRFLPLGCAEEASFFMKGLELSAYKVLNLVVVMVQ